MHGDEQADGLRAYEDRQDGEREGGKAESARDERGLINVGMLRVRRAW